MLHSPVGSVEAARTAIRVLRVGVALYVVRNALEVVAGGHTVDRGDDTVVGARLLLDLGGGEVAAEARRPVVVQGGLRRQLGVVTEETGGGYDTFGGGVTQREGVAALVHVLRHVDGVIPRHARVEELPGVVVRLRRSPRIEPRTCTLYDIILPRLPPGLLRVVIVRVAAILRIIGQVGNLRTPRAGVGSYVFTTDTLRVFLLELRQCGGVFEREARIHRDLRLTLAGTLAALGRNDDDAVRGTHTVER